MTSPSLSALLHLHGLPPLPRSLTGYATQSQSQGQGSPNFGAAAPLPQTPHQHRSELLSSSGQGLKGLTPGHLHQPGRPSPPVPPPRPHSRRSSSSGSSFRASPDHVSNRWVDLILFLSILCRAYARSQVLPRQAYMLLLSIKLS